MVTMDSEFALDVLDGLDEDSSFVIAISSSESDNSSDDNFECESDREVMEEEEGSHKEVQVSQN